MSTFYHTTPKSIVIGDIRATKITGNLSTDFKTKTTQTNQ